MIWYIISPPQHGEDCAVLTLQSRGELTCWHIGIDEDTSLNEQLVTEEGAKFLAEYYDKLISESEYDVSIEEDLLSSYYSKFKS